MRSVSSYASNYSCVRQSLRRKGMSLAVGAGFLLVLIEIVLPKVCTASRTPSLGSMEVSLGNETVSYDSGGTQINAFLAKPIGAGKHPAVIVIHDSQGLTDEFKGIARQLAAAGFVAMAPDLLSRAGGTQASLQAESAIAALPPKVSVEDLSAGFTFLQNDPTVDSEKISAIGFGWGGWRSFKLAATLPGLCHAVIFYGATPVNGLQNVHASVLANYAQYDFFNTGNSIWTADTLKESGGRFTYYIYPKTFRGFFDPGTPYFDAEASRLAWSRTLEFLRE